MKMMQRLSRVIPAGPRRKRVARFCVSVGCAAAAIALCAGLLNGLAQSPPVQDASTPSHAALASPHAEPESNQASAPSGNSAQAEKSAIDPEKQNLVNECEQLLKLATALKTEVDKTTKDTLSIKVVRQAGEIEQLAHKAKAGTGKS